MARTFFISYRRADTEVLAARLNRAFAERFGDERIFFDRDDIVQGTLWRERIAAQVARADTVVALIGTRWQAQLDERAAADDVLRFELATALATRKAVLPVLADGAPMPDAGALPQELRAVAAIQAAHLSSEHFDDDVRALLLSLAMPWSIALGWACANSFAWILGLSLAAAPWRLASRAYGAAAGPEVSAGVFNAGGSPGALLLYAAAGALFALTIGGAQWLVLRRWWPRLGWLPLVQAACGAVAMLLGGAAAHAGSDIAGALAGTGSVVALLALPASTWWAMRRRIDGAGWFNFMNLVVPMGAAIAVVSLIDGGTSDNPLAGFALIAVVFAANLVSGALLMLLIRRAGRRGR
jgi:TIR domain